MVPSCKCWKDKKYIENLLYELAGRHFNKAASGNLYQDTKEVEACSYGHFFTKLAPNLHLVIDKVQHELVEGSCPISHLFLNGMRILLHWLISVLGNEVVAVRTDVVYMMLVGMEAYEWLTEVGFAFAGKKPYKWAYVGGLAFNTYQGCWSRF